MRTTALQLVRVLLLLMLLLLLVCSRSAHGIFFQGPKRAIWNWLEALGGHKKLAPPIQHYHMHYYPVPIALAKPQPHAQAAKIEIDLSALHHSAHEPLASYGWPSHHPAEPDFGAVAAASWAPQLQPQAAWPDLNSLQHKSSWALDNNELLEKDPAYTEAKSGLLLQLPLHQQIVLYQPPAKDKASLLQTLFKKIRRINEAIFHPEADDAGGHGCHLDDDSKPRIHNTLTYAA